MEEENYQFDEKTSPPGPPDILFDGTRLGIEASLMTALSVALLASVHCGLSVALGYFTRYTEAAVELQPFSLFRFILTVPIAAISLGSILFLLQTPSNMLCTMGLVSYMLYHLKRRRSHERLIGALLGGLLGLLFGLPCSAAGMFVAELPVNGQYYRALFTWPGILSFDAISLLWLGLIPLANAAAGARSGWQIGKRVREAKLYFFY